MEESHIVPQLLSLLSPIASSSQKEAFGTLEDNQHWTPHHDSSNTGYCMATCHAGFQVFLWFSPQHPWNQPLQTTLMTSNCCPKITAINRSHWWQPGTSSILQFSTQSTPTFLKRSLNFSVCCPKTLHCHLRLVTRVTISHSICRPNFSVLPVLLQIHSKV